MEKITSNIVFVVSGLLPSFFSQASLSKNRVFEEKDFSNPDTIFIPQLTQVATEGCVFFATAERIQVRSLSIEHNGIMVQKAKSLFAMIPPKSISVIGFNYHIQKDVDDVGEFSRRKFMPGTSRNVLHKEFCEKSCNVGLFFQREYEHCRMNLDIRPRFPQSNPTETKTKGSIELNFNFHFDLSTQDFTGDFSKQWNQWKAEAERIALLLEK